MTELTFEEVDRMLSYDPATGALTWKVSRGNAKASSVAGTDDGQGYLRVRVQGKKYFAHRLAWLLHTGAWPSQQLDHIDGSRTNNRISNLRECSNAENHQNRGKRSDNSSGVQGVCWHKAAKKWMARIKVDGKQIHIGYFDTIEEATAARTAAKAQYHQFNPTDR